MTGLVQQSESGMYSTHGISWYDEPAKGHGGQKGRGLDL